MSAVAENDGWCQWDAISTSNISRPELLKHTWARVVGHDTPRLSLKTRGVLHTGRHFYAKDLNGPI